MSRKKAVELVFREPVKRGKSGVVPYAESSSLEGYMGKGMSIESLQDKLLNLGNFDIDEIDISLEAVVETGPLTQLFVSATGTGGITIILKPKNKN